MKTKLFLAGVLCSMLSGTALSQYYQSVPVSGFTDDVIANGVGPAASSTTNSIDDPIANGANFAYYSKDFRATTSSPALLYGISADGYFNSKVAATPYLPVQMASYLANNSLRLVSANSAGTLTFSTPTAATKVYVIGVSGSGASGINYTVNFSDNTTQTGSFTIGDWYNVSPFVAQGVGRVSRTTNAGEGDAVNPRIYQNEIVILAANQAKTITSVNFQKPVVTGYANIFGITIDKYTTCFAGATVTSSNVTDASATINWTAPSTAPSSYDIYYSSTPKVPYDSDAASISGISGTTANLGSLAPNTRYYVWTRGVCGTTVGTWSFGTTFKTACGSSVAAPYLEDFDTTSTGSTSNTNAPTCWSYLETSGSAGSGYVNAAATANLYTAPNIYLLTNSTDVGASSAQMLVSPNTSNLSSGLIRLKFFAKRGGSAESVIVGTLSNPTDPTTFTAINNATFVLGTTFVEYTVDIPAGSNTYLAFKHGKTGSSRTIYLDNISLEVIASCQEPTLLNIQNVMGTSAQVSWAASPSNPTGNYDLYVSTTNSLPASPTYTNVTSPYNLSNLNPSTQYFVWVRANCTTTQSTPISSSFTTTVTCVPPSGLVINNVTLNSAELTWSPSTTTPSNNYDVYVSSTNAVPSSPTYSNVTSPYTIGNLNPSTTYYVWVRANCTATDQSTLINSNFTTTATCVAPSGLSAGSITSSSASISWTASPSGPVNNYDLYVNTTNTQPATPTYTNVSSSYNLGSLNANTTYYIWLRANCSATDQSTLIAANFTTAFAPPSNDDCSTPMALTLGNNFDTSPYTGTTQGATNTADGSATHSCQNSAYKETWYSVTVPANGGFTVETKSASGSSVTDTVLTAYTGICGSLVQVGCDDDTGDGNFSKMVLSGLTPNTTVLISVWNFSSSTTGEFRVSAYDASILAVSESEKELSKVTVYPNPFTEIVTVSNVKDLVNVVITDLNGRLVKTIDKPEAQLHLGELNAGMYLLTLKYKDGSTKTIKAIKK